MWKLTRNKIIIISLIILLLLGLLVAFVFNKKFSVLRGSPFATSKLNVLIVGYDSSINGPPRADTIILASINLETGETGFLFVPRDTRVEIPGYGIDRINASHAYGGVNLVNKTLEKFLDIPIDYYLETDFKGFASIINRLGGIRINVEKPLHYVDKAGDLHIDLPAGEQILNGEEALQYVRFREPTYGDIGRVRRQQKFLYALLESIMEPETIIKLPGVFKDIRNSVNTNIPIQDISPFVHLLKDVELDQFKTAMVPGEPRYIGGASYWIADREELEVLVNKLIRSKEYIRNNRYYVSVLNGSGQPGIAAEVAEELRKYGFNIRDIGNADNFNYRETVIKYFDKRDRTVVIELRKLLGGEVEYVEKEKKGLEIVVGANNRL